MYAVEKGYPKYGATYDKGGVNFSIFSRNGKRVILEIFEKSNDVEPIFRYELDPNKNKTGDVWHIYVKNLKAGAYYGFRIDGPYEPENGHRFNVNKLLIDPYSKAISGKYNFKDASIYTYNRYHNAGDDLSFSDEDSARFCKSIVIDDTSYDWEEDKHPRIPFKDTIIYEMHIKLFTMNKNSNVEYKGTYKGLTEKIDYLKDLGITAVELLPIFEFNRDANINTNPLTGKQLKDVWGYNPIAFFAPTGNYAFEMENQVFEFKNLVKALHKANIEIILDVVFNHTGEGNEHGPTLSLKGQDNSIFYMLEPNKRYYSNYSGTGNTLNCSHVVTKEMIKDSLRYWVTEMHVDGFRFDLASILGRFSDGRWFGDYSILKELVDDPILSGSKLIAEGWDAGGGYFVGEFPVGWAEWNGKFRDTVRKFVKTDNYQIQDLATRIVGSPDLFGKFGRKPYHSINFITAHDGFTMWDLVSYNKKRNLENGEDNKDGANDNHSWNHGIEGETKNKEILDLRKRQLKNFMTILMISQGVPMILMGDEIARTQKGNNNTYCQDNETVWFDWSRKEEFSDIYRFTKKMIEFRQKHHSLKRSHFFADRDLSGNGVADITWHGIKPYQPDWSKDSHSIAFMISGEDFNGEYEIKKDNDIYVILNSYWEDLEFELPYLKNKKWYRVTDTALEEGKDFLDTEEELSGNKYTAKSRSSVIFISK